MRTRQLQKISWLVAFGYIVYVFLAKIPILSSISIFSASVAFTLLIIVYLVHSFINLGIKRAILFLVVVYIIAFLFEFIGVNIGLPFGSYYYISSLLGPTLGSVPIIIPFLWASLGYFCIITTRILIVTYRIILAASVLITILDISFDPRFSLTLWHWNPNPISFYNVPIINFFGWFLTSLVFFIVYYLTKDELGHKETFIDYRLSNLFYFLFGLNSVLSDIQVGLWIVAIISVVLITLVSLLLYYYYGEVR